MLQQAVPSGGYEVAPGIGGALVLVLAGVLRLVEGDVVVEAARAERGKEIMSQKYSFTSSGLIRKLLEMLSLYLFYLT